MMYPAHTMGLKTFETTFMNTKKAWLPHPSLVCILGTTFKLAL